MSVQDSIKPEKQIHVPVCCFLGYLPNYFSGIPDCFSNKGY